MTTHTLTNYKQVEQALSENDLMQALYDAGKEVLMGDTLVTLPRPGTPGSSYAGNAHFQTRLF